MSTIEKPIALAPRVADALEAAEAKEAALLAEVQSFALDEFLGDPEVKKKRERTERDLAAATAEVARLRAAKSQAEARDEKAGVDATIAELEGQLGAFEAAVCARAEAAAELDRGCEIAAKAWARLVASNDAVRLGLPRGCSFPPGAVVGQELAAMASGALYRHTVFTDIGDTGGAFPGAKAPNLMTQFNPSAIPSAAKTIETENAWLLRAVKGQVAAACRFWRGEPEQEIEQ
jgi:hypothetical protein